MLRISHAKKIVKRPLYAAQYMSLFQKIRTPKMNMFAPSMQKFIKKQY